MNEDRGITRRISGGAAVRCIRWFAGVSYGKDDTKRRIANMSGEWIPVTERLPDDAVENLQTVLLSDGDWVTIGHRSGDGWYVMEAAEALGHTTFDRLPYWMPLPEPPEVK